MKGYLLSVAVIIVCLRSLKAQPTEGCPADHDSITDEVKSLRKQMAEERRSIYKDIGELRDLLAWEAAAASATAAVAKDLEEKLAFVENELRVGKISTTDVLKQQMEDGNFRHSQEEDKIAFSVASYEDFGPVTVDTNIPFEVVHTNIGGAWQANINSFQAMSAGVYLFTASCVGYYSGFTAIVHTTPSGAQRMAMTRSAYEATDGDANTVIFAVDVGDYVSVQLLSDDNGQIWSDPTRIFSTFSGFLLFP